MVWRWGRRRVLPALGHELVELGLVLGEAQAVEEGGEIALFLFQAAQRVLAVLVERPVAAGGLCGIAASAAEVSPAGERHATLPEAGLPLTVTGASTASHTSTP